jgi:hypothetical protein
VLLVTSLAFKALTTYAQTRFALMREYSIGKRLVEGYLHQPLALSAPPAAAKPPPWM